MIETKKPADLIQKGNKGFTFEFKKLENGSIAFIRYLEGDRDFAMTDYIHTHLYTDIAEKRRAIERELLARVGSSARVISKAVELFAPYPADYRTPCPRCGFDQCPGCSGKFEDRSRPESHIYAENPPL